MYPLANWINSQHYWNSSTHECTSFLLSVLNVLVLDKSLLPGYLCKTQHDYSNKKNWRQSRVVSTASEIHTRIKIYNDETSRSTVCFHLVSGWPEARYDILVPVKALRNSKHRKQNITSSPCYNSLCESTYKCIHVGVNTESRKSTDRGKQVLRQKKKRNQSHMAFIWGGISYFLKGLDWSLWFMLWAVIGLLIEKYLNPVKGLVSWDVGQLYRRWEWNSLRHIGHEFVLWWMLACDCLDTGGDDDDE